MHLENESVTSSPYESPVTGAYGKKDILPHAWKMCAVEQYPLQHQECSGIQEHPFTIPRSIVNPWSWKCGLNPSLFLRRKREDDKFAVTRKWSLFQGSKIIEVSSSKCGEGTLRESGKIGRWKTAGHIHLPFLKESPDADSTSKVIFLSHVFQ